MMSSLLVSLVASAVTVVVSVGVADGKNEFFVK